MTISAKFASAAVAALLAPAFAVGAQTTTQTTQPAATAQTTQPVQPKHHSVLGGAAAGAAAGSAIPGHRHPILGAIAGAEVQHHRNKKEKKAYKQAMKAQAAQQQAAPVQP